MIDLGRVADNVLTVLVLCGFFYFIYTSLNRNGSDLMEKVKNLFKRKK